MDSRRIFPHQDPDTRRPVEGSALASIKQRRKDLMQVQAAQDGH
jgi:hypothetical protein